ncbi:PKS-ER domain-containing protein [Fusarium sp. LHS14.1]|nr:PKS-ER domain-containing protein [Fusarium sp. LHS14.1]
MSFENTAAWVNSHNAHPFEIKPAPVVVPEENQILVRNRAIAINPIDHKVQTSDVHRGQIAYPTILGEDVAGEVVAVGSAVIKFKIGDRVAGLAAGFLTNKNEEKTFQAYTILRTDLSVKIPQKYSFQEASAFPLAVGTTAAGLYNTDFLNLRLPTFPAQKPTGEVLLVWGGASAVGCAAIQLGIASGYEVITTASPKNFDLVKRLGASHVFDYKSLTVVADLLEAAKGKKSAGVFDTIGFASWPHTLEFAEKADGVKFISCTVPGWPEPPQGVAIKHVFSLSIIHSHVASAVWDDYLPNAIEAGAFVPAPRPLEFGKGLESLQGAVDFLGTEGVSAQKVVVSLE